MLKESRLERETSKEMFRWTALFDVPSFYERRYYFMSIHHAFDGLDKIQGQRMLLHSFFIIRKQAKAKR